MKPLTIANDQPNQRLFERLREANLSIAEVARRSGVPYPRLWGGLPLEDDEVRRVLEVLEQVERPPNEAA
jgi:hypothetical protein